MTIAFLIGFVVGVIVMFHRLVFDRLAGHGMPRNFRQWVILVVCCVIMGLPTGALFVFIAAPTITFVDRVDTLERRCQEAPSPKVTFPPR